jgi:hypothetical protein
LIVFGYGAASAPGAKTPLGPGSRCGANTGYVCVQGGSTKFNFSASWLAGLRREGWRLHALPPAIKLGNVLRMPIVKSGKILDRRSRVGGISTRNPGGECFTDGSLTVGDSVLHHAGGFALTGHGVRRRFDALALTGSAFYWRGPNNPERGDPRDSFGGNWSGSPRIDFMVSAREGHTVTGPLRVIENGLFLPRSALGVMGKADSFWRVDPYCQVLPPEEPGVNSRLGRAPQ